MSDKTKNPVKWIAKGSLYHKPGDRRTEPKGEERIDIRECPGDISMGSADHEKYGQPIDAMLAIQYIRDLWATIDEEKVFEIYKWTNKFSSGSKGIVKPEEDEMATAFNRLVELLRHSAALTVSRSMLLKILSQPECCGVRFYLGLEKEDGNTEKVKPTEKFTLVMVGVNARGVDLNYKYNKDNHTQDAIPDVETMSLSGEYPAPSGLISSDGPKQLEGETPYPLYQYARHKVRTHKKLLEK